MIRTTTARTTTARIARAVDANAGPARIQFATQRTSETHHDRLPLVL